MKQLSIFIVTTIILCTGCVKQPSSFTGIAMTMPYQVKIADRISSKQKTQVKELIEQVFNDADKCYNHYNPSSEISLINQGNEGIYNCSNSLSQLFVLADFFVNISESTFDPSIGLAIAQWKNALMNHKWIGDSTLSNWKQKIGWQFVTLSKETINKNSPSLYFDFDSFSKGFLIDQLYEKLLAIGLENIYVEWGGEIKAKGLNFLGKPWTVSIRNPHDNNTFIDTLSLDNLACATSGNYLQSWEINGDTFTHFISSNTLKPFRIQDQITDSITVVAPSCAVADGLSTIASLFTDQKKLTQWTKKVEEIIPGVGFWIAYKSQKIEK